MVTFVRGVAVLLVGVALLSGCGGNDDAPDPAKTTASESAAEAATLADTCREIEEGIPSRRGVPTAEEWEAYAAELRGLSEAGDAETRNTLDLLIPAVEELADDRARGQTYLDAQAKLFSALDDVAKRCKAVGATVPR